MHPDHKKELVRLKKIAGQINGVIKMVDDGRYCIDILQQLAAVKSAIHSLQANLLETHLNHCIKGAFSSKKDSDIAEKIEELKEIFKKY